MPLDRARLLKLLQMTRSANDGEALNAIRMANALLDRERAGWDAVLGLAAPDDPLPPPPPWPPEPAFRDGAYDPDADDGGEPALRPGEFLAARLRWRVRQVPLAVRVLLFPLWFAGHAAAAVLDAEGAARRVLRAVAMLAGTALLGVVWLGLVVVALGALDRLPP